MNRKELAGMLEYAADLMEVLGEGEFRSRAYRSAARNIEKLEDDLEELAASGFRGVQGVGPTLAPLLTEIVQSGEFAYLAELEGQVPAGVLELFRVQGLGPKRIRALWDNGVDGLEALVHSAEAGYIRGLPGFGAKTETNLLLAARFALESEQRVTLPVALEAAQLLVFDLTNQGIQAELAGSLRRGLDTIGNLDIVALAEVGRVTPVLGRYLRLADRNVISGELEGLSLRVFCATPENYGSVLFDATGSKAWLSALGSPLSLSPQPTEEAVFAALEKPYVPPYWREKEHIGLEPPSDTLKLEQILGLIHNHSTYSDGTGTLRQMAEAAITRGYAYLVISDHSQTASYAGGLRLADVYRQWEEIERLNLELAPFRILRGIESDILPDGSLDYPDEVLAQFEVVIGSLHANLTMARAEQTQRLLRAIQNPYLTMLGHPSGRIVLRRKGADADWEAVLSKAAEMGKIIEFNCNAARLDLDWRLMLQWRDRMNFSLSPDAHTIEGMDSMSLGLLFAHKAGLRAAQVVNTWEAERLIAVKKMR
jgi:DNA polymerase (family X)